MIQGQYVEQHKALESPPQVQSSSYNSSNQWPKNANAMFMDQMSNNTSHGMSQIQKQQDCSQQMLRLGQQHNMQQMAQYEQARMLMGMAGNMNPMSFMAGGGNLSSQTHSQQQSAGISGTGAQGSMGPNGTSNPSSSTQPQQQ